MPDLQQHFTLYENDQAANGGLFRNFADETTGNWARNGTTLTYFPRNLPIADQVVVLGTTKDVFVVKGRSNQQRVSNLVFDGLHLIGSDFTTSWPGGVTGFDAWTGIYDGVQINNKPIGVIFPEARHGHFFVENAENIVIRNSKLYGAGFIALYQEGRGDLILERMAFWRDLVAQGLKAPVEQPEPSRSDCHAWVPTGCKWWPPSRR